MVDKSNRERTTSSETIEERRRRLARGAAWQLPVVPLTESAPYVPNSDVWPIPEGEIFGQLAPGLPIKTRDKIDDACDKLIGSGIEYDGETYDVYRNATGAKYLVKSIEE